MSSLTNPEPLLKGKIDITDNLGFVMDVINSCNPNVIVVNLDEFNARINGQFVIQGVELLPPPEAIMAEQEGDEQSYDMIYDMWFNDPALQLFVSGILVTLYRSKNMLMYFPDLDPSESITIPKLLGIFWQKFGIGIGVFGKSMCSYNWLYAPIWLKMMYTNRVICADEFLYKFPDDAILDSNTFAYLITDISPVGGADPMEYILEHRRKLKGNPNVKIPLFSIVPPVPRLAPN